MYKISQSLAYTILINLKVTHFAHFSEDCKEKTAETWKSIDRLDLKSIRLSTSKTGQTATGKTCGNGLENVSISRKKSKCV